VNHPSSELKKQIEAADAEVVRIKTERQLIKPNSITEEAT